MKNEIKVGSRVVIGGREYQVSRDSTSRWVRECNSDFAVQPINPKTGNPWQKEQAKTISELEETPRDLSVEAEAYNKLHARPVETCDTCGSTACDGHPYL
jgi:hypothetical protein